MPLCLHVVCGCVHAAIAELSSCDSDLMAHTAENIYYVVYRKLLPTSIVKGQCEKPQVQWMSHSKRSI